jgi:hypothetical protein
MSRFLVSLCLLASAATSGQTPDTEVAAVQSAYEFGKYEEALKRAKDRIDRGALTEDTLVELHKYAGLSAFSLSRMDEAERHFTVLLKLNPDAALDPFVVAPPAVAFFEQQRKKLGASLDVIRERRAERLRGEEEARKRAAEDEQRRRMEELARRTTVRTVEHRSFLVNFVPFGAGQFQQGRNGFGVFFAVTEAVLAGSSIAAFFAYQNLIREQEVVIETSPGQRQTLQFSGIPASRVRERDNWRLVKYASGIGFYGVWAIGIADALWHHQDRVETTHTAGAAESRAQLRPLFLPGGVGAGLTFRFQ